jgi:CrcB protein
MARHGVNAIVHRWWSMSSPFPMGIFLVNVLGSLLIGLFAGLLGADRVHAAGDARLFLVVGLLGGFTTFSSFSLDTLTLLRDGHLGLAAWNAFGQVALGVVAAMAGYRFGSL